MGRPKKKVIPSSTTQDFSPDLVRKLADKLEIMETQIKERDTKIELLDKNQKQSGIGSNTYGISVWKEWKSGSDQGYHRSIYVDIKSMLMPRAY